MNKILASLFLCASFLFAARVTVNVNGVEQTHVLVDGDQLKFSEDEDTLYLTTSDTTQAFVLGKINRITLDTIGGGLGYVNIVNSANAGLLALPLSSVEGIIFEPDNKDTSDWDGDGLSNYDEMVIYGTDPKKTDTDGDGFSDYMELTQFSSASDNFSFNPLIADLPSVKVSMIKYPAVSVNYTK
ncbi:MAG TPA: hypothetical protein VLM37_06945, partial [Fibrobacteraceae bacterium]|nr:hypothetical protein [Fibrobacteraceae bacterium]